MSNDSQITVLARWSLDDLFSGFDDPALEAALSGLDVQAEAFAACRATLREDLPVPEFLQIIGALEKLHTTFERLYGFAGLSFSADTQDQAAQTLMARVEQAAAGIENRTLFFTLWWKDLPQSAAERLLADSGDYRYWLEMLRRYKPHTLSEAEEKVINLKNVTGIQAIHRFYDTITNKYTFTLRGLEGIEEKERTREELMTYVRHPSAEVREAAYRELYRVYGENGPLLGQIYQTVVLDWYNENISLRRFPNPNAARNLENDIPDAVVDTLLDVCKRNAPLFQRFFRVKARRLGLPRLRRFDLYAPVDKPDKKYPYGQAVAWVLECFGDFDPKMGALARQVFESRHLDSESRKGKRGGAFSWGVVKDLPPWVLVNYQGQSEDVTTLAHEMGHAVHSLLASHHTQFTVHPCLPLAETASTFAEMLVVDRMLAEEEDENARRSLLYAQADSAYATIMRQSFFGMFERQAHEMIRGGAPVDEVAAAYLANLEEQFGDALALDDVFRWEWVSIPHFYSTPFYVYAYSFGQLLVLALYSQYRREGAPFKKRYLTILEAGGAESPLSILEKAGIDPARAEFWQGGFDVVASWIEGLEA